MTILELFLLYVRYLIPFLSLVAYISISRYVQGLLPSRSRIGSLTVRAQAWEGIFRRFDKNHNNTIDGDELHDALKHLGYELSPQHQDLLKRKYGTVLSFEHPISSAHCSRLLIQTYPGLLEMAQLLLAVVLSPESPLTVLCARASL